MLRRLPWFERAFPTGLPAHLLPVVVSPSVSIPVDGGRPLLGTWQRVVVVDPNRENDERLLRLTFVPA